MKGVMNLAKEWLGWKKEIRVAKDTKAEFLLFLGDLLVGILSVTDGKWKFEYSDAFRQESEFRPLVEFPDLNKVYEKEQLWQFLLHAFRVWNSRMLKMFWKTKKLPKTMQLLCLNGSANARLPILLN